jgi:hypothetical protein
VNPKDEEMPQAREACGAMMREWREQGLKMTLKAHICEDHLCDINKSCWGIGGMVDESFVDHYHQVAGRASERICNVPDIDRQSVCALKFEVIVADRDVSSKVTEVNTNAKRKFKDVDRETGRRRSVQANINKEKEEKENKRVAYVKGTGNALHNNN